MSSSSSHVTDHACVFGLGWGDEGKGKVVDLLCPSFDFVVRFNGGANAGHTVCVGQETFALHLLPTGVLHDNITAVIGPGVVVDPIKLIEEIDVLAGRGIDVRRKLRISDRAHLVLPYHFVEDQLSEQAAGRGGRIGTTSRGIGPCYADKMRRTTAVRFADVLHDDDLSLRVRRIVEGRKTMFRAVYGGDGELDENAVMTVLSQARDRLSPMITDTTALLQGAIQANRPVLFEGANGILLDVDHGTYPFVTSSSTGPYGIGPGAGVFPSCVKHRVGVSKAYSTRVGSGPFATELDNEVGEHIRQAGHEFGTTTGRARRCGWFDAVACKYSAGLSAATDLALMHMDTLSGFDEVGICVGYRVDGETVDVPPADRGAAERVEPIIEHVPGWQDDLRAMTRFDDLPKSAKSYIERIETLVGVKVTMVGVGPDRSQTLVRGALGEMIGEVAPPMAQPAP